MALSPWRRTSCVAAALAAGVAVVLAPPLAAPASADDDATLTVVGTSDVFDSHLVQEVLEPGFEAAFPQYDLKYVSQGTGAAINYAKAGSASAMIVHAAALENQFVADGYSAEPYGRAIFWGDYVLLGPASDPAGVLTNAPNDIVTAYERIAAAGAAGDAEFVSRGGTPGTTVQEHAIWALTDSSVSKCDVSAGNGGGQSPSTTSGACGSPIAYPSWYHATGQTQGPNILTGDACNGYVSEACYVFTDRGTFQYLKGTGAIQDLDIVTRDNDVAGQLDLLINSFHAYAINPAKFADNPNVRINSAAATAFLDWMTSPDVQARIGTFLGEGGDPAFIPSASPKIKVDPTPSEVDGGSSLELTGSVTNVVPGTPALDDVEVRLFARPTTTPGADPVQVARTRTTSTGRFRFAYQPQRSLAYTVATGPITKIEVDSLDPNFGDLLAPSSSFVGRVEVRAAVELRKAIGSTSRVRVLGSLKPRAVGTGGKLALYAKRAGGQFKLIGSRTVEGGQFDETFNLGKGAWRVRVGYRDPGTVLGGTSLSLPVSVR